MGEPCFYTLMHNDPKWSDKLLELLVQSMSDHFVTFDIEA